MLREQIRMAEMPDPDKPIQYKNLVDLFEDENCPEDRKLSIMAHIYKMATHNSVTKAELIAILRWVIDENYDWVPPEPEPHLKVVK